MKKINLFVSQKYVDLNAISAFQALSIYLEKSNCKALTRYVNWEIVIDTQLDDEVVVNRLTQGSFLLFNPNKEDYVSSLNMTKDNVVYVSIEDNLDINNSSFLNQLRKLSGLSIHSVQKKIVWACTINEATQESRRQYIQQHLLGVNGVASGFLLNPIYESFSFLN